jgi:hypothetical protein
LVFPVFKQELSLFVIRRKKHLKVLKGTSFLVCDLQAHEVATKLSLSRASLPLTGALSLSKRLPTGTVTDYSETVTVEINCSGGEVGEITVFTAKVGTVGGKPPTVTVSPDTQPYLYLDITL